MPPSTSSPRAWRCSSTFTPRTAPRTESERANWHAHLLITTRRIEAGRLRGHQGPRPRSRRCATPGAAPRGHGRRRLGRAVARAPGPATSASTGWRRGSTPTATHAREHVGPVRMRRAGAEIVPARRDHPAGQPGGRPRSGQVLAALTRSNATFTERDLDRFLAKQLGQEGPTATAVIASVRPGRRAEPARCCCRCATGTRATRPDGSPRGRCGSRSAQAMAAAGRPGPPGVRGGVRRRRSCRGRGADAAAGPAGGVRARGRGGAPQADRGAGGHREELHAGGDPRRARAGRQAGGGPGADQRRGAGPGGGRVPRGGHRARRPVRAEERAHRVGQAHRGGGGRGGDAGHAGDGELLAAARQAGPR